FDDLVTKAEELLRRRGDVADAIAARWDYLLVDEFQDVNAVQYDLLKRLAAPHGNFFAVGDDEQSIFTWTGADPYVLVRFGRDYEIDQPIVLDKNCRCSRQIFETARRVLSPHFLQEVLASPPFPLSATWASPPDPLSTTWRGGTEADFLAAVRTLARRRPAQDPDTKKLWRLVFQVENLRALPRAHQA